MLESWLARAWTVVRLLHLLLEARSSVGWHFLEAHFDFALGFWAATAQGQEWDQGMGDDYLHESAALVGAWCRRRNAERHMPAATSTPLVDESVAHEQYAVLRVCLRSLQPVWPSHQYFRRSVFLWVRLATRCARPARRLDRTFP